MKVKIGSLPDGWKVINGKVVKTMAHGGTVNKTLGPIDRESANLEAEKGETALTDLTNDGSFELYNIGGKRHTEGGTPLNLPEQSFVYSDTRSMKLTVEELMSLGIKSNKKMTPAEASKRFPLNEFIETLESENSDKVSIDTAEEMIDKNKIKLSQIAFIQESKKDFSDGLPLAAYPFLVSKGINPQEMEAKIAEKNAPQQNPSPQMSQDQMAMGPQQGLQEFTGPPQGAMPPMGPPMGMKNGGDTHTMPDGTVHPGATHEEYMAMMGQGQNNMYKMGGDLPKAQWGLAGRAVDKGKKVLNYVNPFAGKATNNWLISKGGVSNDLINTKLNLGNNNLGLINTDQGYFGDTPTMENIKVGPDSEGYGLGTQLYNKGLQVGTGKIPLIGQEAFSVNSDVTPQGLISGDQSINAMESPEKTVAIWKYFNKEVTELKPWTQDKDKMWTEVTEKMDFSTYLKEVDGVMTYTGPEVRLTGLNELGKKKVMESEAFFKELQLSGANTGTEGSSPILNWESTLVEGVGPDWHSPIGRSMLNKFKTSFGREPRIGNGAPGDQTFQEYNKAGLYLLLGLGAFSIGNQDKIENSEEDRLYLDWKKKRALEYNMTEEEYDEYLITPENTLPIPNKQSYDIEDSLDQGLDIKRLGGQPFKMNSLRKFTDGGQSYGAAPIPGGMLDEVEVFGNAAQPTQISAEEQLLMNMAEQRRLLLQSYSGIESRVKENPNVLEDPEEGTKIQMQIAQIEKQIADIDLKTSTIEQQLMQGRLQIDPFAQTGQPPMARYGGALPKYQKKGQTYGDWMKEKGYPLDADVNPDLKWDGTKFVGTRKEKGERPLPSESSFTWRDDQGNLGSQNPYFRDESGADYDAGNTDNYNKGADAHTEFFEIMQGDEFSSVRDLWLEKSKQEILNSPAPKGAVAKAALLKLQNKIKAGGADLDAQLFKDFNMMNKILQQSSASGKSYNNTTEMIESYSKQMGITTPTKEQIMTFQGFYGGMAKAQSDGSASEKKLLEQVNLNFGKDQVGANPVGDGFVSKVDGFIGATSGEQFIGVNDDIEDVVVPEEVTVKCTGEVKRIAMDDCVEKKMKFDPETCGCLEIPPLIPPTEKPRYETFDQDDLAVSVKSGQFPQLINPTRQATPDPAMVDPMYVDPRQQLSSLEATAASAIRAGANATSVMGAMQDQSEKVINKHESLNTKIYNNAMNVNVPALQRFTQSNMENEKNYMDETAMAMGNYQTEYKDAEDSLLDAEQTQMSNADEMYIRNLENPNYWFSPKDHNIEFYNEKGVNGDQTPGAMTYDAAYTYCSGKFADEAQINNCIKQNRGVANNQPNTDTKRNNDGVTVSLGKEVRGFGKRQADLQKSRKKLNKWITGH